METNFEFLVNHHLEVVFHIFKGEITTEQILKHLNGVIFSPEHRDDYNILIDIRDATLVDFIEKLDEFAFLLQSITGKINMDRSCAFLTDKPEHVAYSTLFIFKLEDQRTGMRFSIFSTYQAALNWLRR